MALPQAQRFSLTVKILLLNQPHVIAANEQPDKTDMTPCSLHLWGKERAYRQDVGHCQPGLT